VQLYVLGKKAGKSVEPANEDSGSRDPFNSFRRMVWGSQTLQERLSGFENEDALIAECVAAGREYGFAFSAKDVDDALRQGERSWKERWIG
jgi:hypothetical protein